MKLDETLDRIVKEVSRELGITEFQIIDAVDHCFETMKRLMSHREMPKILIHNFGTFRVKHYKLRHQICKKISQTREGEITREEFFEYYNRMRPVLLRLEGEERKSKVKRKLLRCQYCDEKNYK